MEQIILNITDQYVNAAHWSVEYTENVILYGRAGAWEVYSCVRELEGLLWATFHFFSPRHCAFVQWYHPPNTTEALLLYEQHIKDCLNYAFILIFFLFPPNFIWKRQSCSWKNTHTHGSAFLFRGTRSKCLERFPFQNSICKLHFGCQGLFVDLIKLVSIILQVQQERSTLLSV